MKNGITPITNNFYARAFIASDGGYSIGNGRAAAGEDDIAIMHTYRAKLDNGKEYAGTPYLVIPPQAGHASYIADFDKDQSIIETVLESQPDSPVYAIEWVSATQRTKHTSYSGLVNVIKRIVDNEGLGSVNLIGLCQGGTLATVYAAMYPSDVKNLIIAGAPIDVTVPTLQPSLLKKAFGIKLNVYENVIKMYNGVMPGMHMLALWMANDPIGHMQKYWTKPRSPDDRFWNWYYRDTQDIAGAWYLEVVQNVFLTDNLARGIWELKNDKGKMVEVVLGNITADVTTLTGSRDEITPYEQTLTLFDYLTGVKMHDYSIPDTGHIGVFMSKKAMPIWAHALRKLN